MTGMQPCPACIPPSTSTTEQWQESQTTAPLSAQQPTVYNFDTAPTSTGLSGNAIVAVSNARVSGDVSTNCMKRHGHKRRQRTRSTHAATPTTPPATKRAHTKNVKIKSLTARVSVPARHRLSLPHRTHIERVHAHRCEVGDERTRLFFAFWSQSAVTITGQHTQTQRPMHTASPLKRPHSCRIATHVAYLAS